MKAYGLPRVFEVEYPDLYDIHRFGLKSSASRIISKRGDIKNSFRRSHVKRSTRRYWKRKARAEGKITLQDFDRDDPTLDGVDG